jgi:hypothetical protein
VVGGLVAGWGPWQVIARTAVPEPAAEPLRAVLEGASEGACALRYQYVVRLVGPDRAVRGIATGSAISALVATVHRGGGADGCIAGVDRRTALLKRDGFSRAAVVLKPGGVETRIRPTECGAGRDDGTEYAARETTRRAVVDVVASINDGTHVSHAIAAQGATCDDSVGDRHRATVVVDAAATAAAGRAVTGEATARPSPAKPCGPTSTAC